METKIRAKRIVKDGDPTVYLGDEIIASFSKYEIILLRKQMNWLIT